MPLALFQPFKLGDLDLPNRIVMAPLTRNRAISPNTVPSALAPLYYASARAPGCIITEASQISQQGQGYIWTPGCYSDAQVEGWREVTKAVHEANGRIFLQMWHVGRISHTSACSRAAARRSRPRRSAPRPRPSSRAASPRPPMPRALEIVRSPGIVEDYAQAPRQCASARASTASRFTPPTAI